RRTTRCSGKGARPGAPADERRHRRPGSVSSRIPPILRPEHPTPRPLAGLVQEFGLEYRGDLDGVEVTGVTLSTNDLHPGDLFVGVPGSKAHGASFATAAAEGGAVAIVTDEAGAELAADSGLPIVLVPSPRAALGEIAAWVYRTDDTPPLCFGAPGTNAKTPPGSLLRPVIRRLGPVPGPPPTPAWRMGFCPRRPPLSGRSPGGWSGPAARPPCCSGSPGPTARPRRATCSRPCCVSSGSSRASPRPPSATSASSRSSACSRPPRRARCTPCSPGCGRRACARSPSR